jgi:cytochrome P450
MPTLETIDLAAKSFWARPQSERDAAFTVLRREDPVPWSRPAESDLLPPELNTKGFWSLTKHADIRWASRRPEIFSSAEGITMEDFDPLMKEAAQSFIAMDAPRHTQLRGITRAAFTPANMRRIHGWIHGHVRDLFDEMVPKGEADFVKEVSVKLPGRIFSSFYGLEEGDRRDATIQAAQDLLAWTDPDVAGEGPDAALTLFTDCVMTLHQTAAELAEERRAAPGDDLMSWMLAAEFEGRRMTDEEICAFFVLLAVAANDTTRHSTAHAIHAFTQFPDQRAALLEDVDGRVETAVEEVLRWASPLLHMRRTATQDVTVRDAEIKAGDKVVLWYCSGNRDEEVYEDPFRFDILREPNSHVAFGGGGPHFCLGAALARQMLKYVLYETYTRIPDIEAPEPDFLVANFINGIKRLPATWTPPGK